MSSPHEAEGIHFARGGQSVERIAALLRDGPLHTAALAERALGMSGNPGVAARAVWAVLGDDPRFAVSADGTWSFAAPAPRLDRLRDHEFVVVDVETTGGTPDRGHRVTEVAAVVVTRGEIGEVYSSLVNPQRPIPPNIIGLTGITNQMVAGAPPFTEVSGPLMEILRGRVFVAHNAPFDWRFLCAELGRAANVLPAGPQLCTVRLSRRLLPQLPSRSLDALVKYFRLTMESRHRAKDDAVATAHLLLRLFEMLEERGVESWPELEAFLRKRTPRGARRAGPRWMDSP